jgi:hypothetical protein
MLRLLVSVSDYEGDWPISCGYFVTDRLTHEPTRASTDLEELGLTAGERICRVSTRASGKYVNYDLFSVARIDGEAVRRMVEDFRYHKLCQTARRERAAGRSWTWPRRQLSRFRDGVTIFDLPQEDARRMFRLAERLAYEREQLTAVTACGE